MQRLARQEFLTYTTARRWGVDGLSERSEAEWHHQCMKTTATRCRSDGGAVLVRGMAADGRWWPSLESEFLLVRLSSHGGIVEKQKLVAAPCR